MKYPHLLSPVKAGNLLLKNRLIAGNSLPHFLQGPESFPAEPVINHVVGIAKNGAAVVTFADWTNKRQRESYNEDGRRFPMFDLDDDPSVENYLCQLADQVHYYGSRISLALMPFAAPDPLYDVNDEPAVDLAGVMMPEFGQRVYDNYGMEVMARDGGASKALSKEQIHDIIETQAQRVKKYQAYGFDMCTLHFAYRATLFGRFISPRTNRRTDEYGGSLENRARFMLELCERIKELCGRGFPIEVQYTAREEGGTTIEDSIRLAKLAEGFVDIFQFRADTANLNHPTGYNSRKNNYAVLDDCAAVKASGTSILCAPIGGFLNIDDMERILADGKADMIAGARMFLCDFDFYQKVKTSRGEDMTPCIRCNKCHVPSLEGHWLSGCSVNPRMGIEHRLEKLTTPAGAPKKIAVVGGGPAGMRAALLCAQRGHRVTLYEAADRLGGQLLLMDYPSFKWPLAEYRKWCVGQLEKSTVDVRLCTRVTRETLDGEGYEALILAMGAVPAAPPIEGAQNARNIFGVFGHESEFGHRCVVIGGSESGTEAGLYLAENGHDVTVLTRGDTLAADATPIHYRETMDEYYQRLDNIRYITHAKTTRIGEEFVEYEDQNGTHRLLCDSVVALGGMRPLQEDAMALYGIVPDTFVIGDCLEVGNILKCNRAAFAAAYNL